MKSLFERCYRSEGNGTLEEKTIRLWKELESNPPPHYDGLRMCLLEGVKPLTKVRFPDGRVREMLMLGSNSFLNLNYHPRVLEAERKAAERYGCGAGSPPLYAGRTELHDELEAALAEFTGKEAALIFSAGYAGNIGVISGLCRSGDLIFGDSSNHASLVDGALLSGAELIPYLHRNPRHLKRVLAEADPQKKGRLIVSDGVFSMEGSLAPVDELLRLKKEYGCLLMIDDAHGFWAVGDRGRGTASIFGLRDEVDLHYGTFSKALGSVGGFCCASKELINYLRYYARSTFFSSALPPENVAGVLESIRVVAEEKEHLENLKRNRDFFQNELEQRGFNTLESRSAIIPILVGDEEKLARFQHDLFEHGLFSNIGTTPAINARKCRLRLNVMATHTLDQLASAVNLLETLGKKHAVLCQ